VAVKKKLAKKLFSLQSSRTKKEHLSVLTHNPRTFTYLTLFFPNQVYYALLSALLTFINIRRAAQRTENYSLIFWGIAY